MTLASLLEEYDLSLDDIRWYLASLITNSILENRDRPEEITRRIWSGALEAELYNMEEAYLKHTQEDLSRGLTDEQFVRDQFEQARLLKMRRPR